MPTPDASQFTQLKKYSAINTGDKGQVQQKTITHLYQPVPSVTRPRDFLASFTNKFTPEKKFSPINTVAGIQYKPKVPGGNTNGQSGYGGGCIPVVINITDIATQDPTLGWYVLNEDYTVTECQILNIYGQLRIAPGQTLTNRGTITIANGYSIQTFNNTASTGGTINNIGSITISSGAYIVNNNKGSGQAGGIINNSGSIVIGNTAFIENQNYPINPLLPGYGGGIIKNTGTITIDVGGVIDNRKTNGTVGGYIYTYGGGVTQNNGSIYNDDGLVSTANGLSTCGTGTFTGTAPSGGTINTACPP